MELPGVSPHCDQVWSGSDSLAAQDKQTTKSFKIHSLKPTINLNLQLALVPKTNRCVAMKLCGKAFFFFPPQLTHFSYFREQSGPHRTFQHEAVLAGASSWTFFCTWNVSLHGLEQPGRWWCCLLRCRTRREVGVQMSVLDVLHMKYLWEIQVEVLGRSRLKWDVHVRALLTFVRWNHRTRKSPPWETVGRKESLACVPTYHNMQRFRRGRVCKENEKQQPGENQRPRREFQGRGSG